MVLTTRSQMIGNIARNIDIVQDEKPEEGLLFLLLRSYMLEARLC